MSLTSFDVFPVIKFVKTSGPWMTLNCARIPGTAQLKGNMKEINYKNKKLKLPYDLKDGETSTELVTRQNPFSGQSIELPEFAAVIYDNVINLNLKAEMKDKAMGMEPGFSDNQDDWQKVRDGINFFRQYFAKEYMVLLD